MCLVTSLSNGGGLVSPVRTMAFRMIILSFSSCVQVKSKWLIVCSEGALWREPGGGLLYWEPWRMCKGRLWGRASLSIGAPLGNLEGGSHTSNFERWMEEGSRNGASLFEGNPERGLLYWGPRRISQVRLWKWAVVSIEDPLLGNTKGRYFPTTFERREKCI